MISPRRAASRSLVGAYNSEYTANRVSEIKSVPNCVKRLGLLGAHHVAQRCPALLATVTGVDKRLLYLAYLDEGFQSEVYRIGRSGGEVLKVSLNDSGLSSKERRQQADKMQHDHDLMTSYMGRYVVPHEVQVGPHPLEFDNQTIQIIQPFCEVDYLQLADDNKPMPTFSAELQAVNNTYPTALTEIGDALQRSRRLYDEHGLSTDLIGRNNLGMNMRSGSFIITDAQPVTTKDPDVQAAMLHHFDRLGSALELAAA